MILLIIQPQNNCAQTGNYFVTNYLPKNYQAAANNSGITQDNTGLIFVANNDGILIYDGINWDICKRPDEVKIMSIARTPEGEIAVGTEDGDIAILKRTKNGRFKYVSLLDKLNEKDRPTDIIRQIISSGKSTFFLSSDKLVEYTAGELRAYQPIESFHSRTMLMGKHVFVTELNSHISVLLNGKLIAVPGTEALSSEKHFFCYKIDPNRYAICFRNVGMYIAYYDSLNPRLTRFVKKESNCDAEFLASEVNNGCLLNTGNFIATTNLNGAFEIDTSLSIVRHFTSKNGIYDNNVKSAFEDVNGNVWLALYYGVSFIETNSRLFQYKRENGIAGTVQSASYFKNILFAATDKGLQYYDTYEEKFKVFNDFNKQTWFLFSSPNKLFIGTDKGLYTYEKEQLKQLSQKRTFCIYNDSAQKNILYVGTDEGVEVYWMNESEVRLTTTYNLNSEIKSIAGNSDKNIFFVSQDHTIYFLNFKNDRSLDSISKNESLPPQKFETFVFSFNGKLLLGTDAGIYSLISNGGNYKCIKDPDFWELTKNSQVFRASQVGNGILCGQSYIDSKNRSAEKITYLEKDSQTHLTKARIQNHLSDVTLTSISNDTFRNLVFICANEGLFILNNKRNIGQKTFNMIIKRLVSGFDTLLEYNSLSDTLSHLSFHIAYSNNDIILDMGFTSYETSSMQFCYMLEGRNQTFSSWESENRIYLSDLREGDYVLKIKAKTELEDKEYSMSIPFTISPPWYRTVIAYIIYFLIFLAIIIIAVKLNSKRLIELNRKLEKTIEERTSTISHQKEEIEHKQKEILDSINYAQRIQRALLASEKLLDKNLPEYFVFFQPKDVVSGDFYWAAELKNKQFALVTADSTGHGVPGAIMSMLNISCLKEAVESEKLTSAKDILNHTRKKVIETLANDGSESGGKDGMDCSLLCLDLKNKQFTYAAANNPVWVIRTVTSSSDEGAYREVTDTSSSRYVPQEPGGATRTDNQRQLIELSPDKMPVGKHDRDSVSFNEHVFELQKGDVIYTLTDGLPDQFGGPKGKKFMYKQLKEVLLSISHLNMPEQKTKIYEALENWRGYNEQVDDICLIGVKV